MPTGSVLDEFARSIDVAVLSTEQFLRVLETLHMLDSTGSGIELDSLSTDVLAAIVRAASKEQLAGVARHPQLRALFLEEVFRRMADHFSPERAGDADIVVTWRFPNGDDYDRYQTVIEDGRCVSTADCVLTPDTTITAPFDDFLRVATGNARPASQFVRGKLKVKGDYAPAVRMLSFFDLPGAA
ncbi:SCP2 sterol-binding domain-containing protein [Prauserella halophila]|uniref:SCP2 sterol-binding domain-containing protein n=1 Tax=Prauserella halophila TaxID=185641 RepID=UPI0020A53681|nr:alkyl sulfatase C-terminal domain-containing protein [Prauserella halophila]MCP2236774.1 Alkyl sulfatase C-terminal [Prauserella halophila]